MSESEVQRDILLAAPSVHSRLFRNNSGKLKDSTDRWVSYGLGNSGSKSDTASSDLIGWTTVEGIAVFTAMECKGYGWRPRNQADKERLARQMAFIDAVNASGGIAALCYCVQDFIAAVNAFIQAH